MVTTPEDAIRAAQDQVDSLLAQIEQARQVVKHWTDASANLSQSVAEARAKNQGAGRGIGGALLGSKFRSAMRRMAAQSNAAIAREVAEKRAAIAREKHAAQDQLRDLQAQLRLARSHVKSLMAEAKAKARKRPSPDKSSREALTLLKKLKEAHDLGLLTDEEFEQKRRKLALDI